jgi:amidase
MRRRDFLESAAAAVAAAHLSRRTAAFTPEPFELEELTIGALQDGMAAGKWTARAVTERYLERIDQLDRRGPELRLVIETNPDAPALADALDRERRDGHVRGPLHGVPVLLKDNVGTADRMTTTAGSLALEGWTPPHDAFLAARLRAAGAVLLGKANMSEWANFRSTRSTSGWSGRGGLARNPYALDRNTSGSSSGSAAGVSANYCAVAVGTETDGSIVSPASINGIVGIKPTLGLVSRTGVIPLSHSQDTAGPMARTVRDAAILLGVLAGVDPADAATAAAGSHVAPDYTAFLDPDGLRGARLGVPRTRFFGYSPHTDRVAEAALDALKRLGAVLVDPAELPNADKFGDAENEVLLHDFKTDINAFFAQLGPGAPVRSLEQLIAFNEHNRDRELPFFGQELLEQAVKKGPLTSPAYRRALATCRRLTRAEGIDAVLRRHRLDALVMPTDGPAWLTDLVNGDHFLGGSSSPAAVAGYPHVTVPAGFSAGLPVGLSFVGTAWSEPKLLRYAYAFEQATKQRRPPAFKATISPDESRA